MDTETNVLETVGSKKTFFSHVFSTTEEGKAEILNIAQYSLMGVIPIVILNKLIQRFIPEADSDKSTVEILIEVLLQILVMFIGTVLIHRVITFFPTYSEFKYESLNLTNVILGFLILVLSIQTKIGIKVNILVDRAIEVWNGRSETETKPRGAQPGVLNYNSMGQHTASRGDNLDTSQDLFPPAPMVTSKPDVGADAMIRGVPNTQIFDTGPLAANGIVGGSFGSSF